MQHAGSSLALLDTSDACISSGDVARIILEIGEVAGLRFRSVDAQRV
jgi:hypothetical protein